MLDYVGRPYDTTHHYSNCAGKGFAICAFFNNAKSKKKKVGGGFYAGNHCFGEFHHSSFFAGEPVHFAGEIQVEAGRLKVITHKSGQPVGRLNWCVRWFRQPVSIAFRSV